MNDKLVLLVLCGGGFIFFSFAFLLTRIERIRRESDRLNRKTEALKNRVNFLEAHIEGLTSEINRSAPEVFTPLAAGPSAPAAPREQPAPPVEKPDESLTEREAGLLADFLREFEDRLDEACPDENNMIPKNLSVALKKLNRTYSQNYKPDEVTTLIRKLTRLLNDAPEECFKSGNFAKIRHIRDDGLVLDLDARTIPSLKMISRDLSKAFAEVS